MDPASLNVYALICTRNRDYSETTKALTSYLSRCGVKVKLLIGENSIFSAYKNAFEKFNTSPNDVFILCHDDIEILSSQELFKRTISKVALSHGLGFVGVAGTTKLTRDSVWWNQAVWAEGRHRGYVFHGTKNEMSPTWYGVPGQAVVMDGLFLMARADTLEKVDLSKPEYFSGEWDFYDLHYTMTAHKLNLKNMVEPIIVRHESHGELVGRDSWHNNRLTFIQQYFSNTEQIIEI